MAEPANVTWQGEAFGFGFRLLGRKIIIASAVLTVVAIFIKGAGFVEKRLLGHYFGVGDRLDTYLLALKLSLMGYFVFRSILRPAVTPILTTLKNRSAAEARNFGLSLAVRLGALLTLATIAGIIFAAPLVRFSAVGFSHDKQADCVRMTQWLLPLASVLCMANLLGLSLHVQKRFALAAAGDFLQKSMLILCIAFVAAPLGFNYLVAAQWISVAALFGFLVLAHRSHLQFTRRGFRAVPELGEIARLAWPVAIGTVVGQFARLIQSRYASEMEAGSVTALTFAQTAVDLPLNLIPLSLTVVLLPYFAELSDRKEYDRSALYLARSARFLLLVFVPVGAYVFWFRLPLVRMLFGSGRFDDQALSLTAQALGGMALGLPVFALEMVIMNYFYASRRMIVPMICGLVATAAAVAALPWLASRFGLAGVSAYLTLSRTVKVVLLAVCIYNGGVRLAARRTVRFSAQLAGAVGICAGLVYACGLYGYSASASGPPALVPFALITAALCIIYVAAVFLLGVEECRWVLSEFRKRVAGFRGSPLSGATGARLQVATERPAQIE